MDLAANDTTLREAFNPDPTLKRLYMRLNKCVDYTTTEGDTLTEGHIIQTRCGDRQVSRILLHLAHRVGSKKIPGTFHQGAARPAQTTANLPSRGLRQRRRREQFHGDIHGLCLSHTSDNRGSRRHHQPDNAEQYT